MSVEAQDAAPPGRPPSRRSLVALGCGAVALLVWLGNVLEVLLVPPLACSIGRMRFESYLFMARPAAMLLSLFGLVLAVVARRNNPRLRVAALVVCALGVAVAVAFLRRWTPAVHLPCLRD